MADAMIGFGIGLTGTPKDYTSIVAARQRQKQLGELEEKKKKQAMNEDILKSISVPSGLVMDYRTKEMEQATANFVREAQDAIEKQDINTLAQLKQQYKMLWDQRVAERKVYDEDLKNYETGKTVYRRDPRLLIQAKTPEEALKLSQEYPDSFYSSDYGNVTLKPISRLDLTQIYKKTASDLPVTRIEKTTKDAQGRPIKILEDQIQASALEARLRSDYSQDPLIRSNVEINYTGDLSGLTPEQKDKVLQDVFVKNGMDWAGKSGYKILGGRGDTNVTVNMGGTGQQDGSSVTFPGQEKAVTVVAVTDAQGKVVSEKTGEIAQGPVFSITGTGTPQEAIVASGGRLVNIKTNEVRERPGSVKIEYSQASPALQNGSKYNILVFKEYDKEGKGVGTPIATYKPGQFILEEDLPYIKPQYKTFIKTVISAPTFSETPEGRESGDRYVIDKENFTQANIKASGKDADLVRAAIKQGIELTDKWNREARAKIGSSVKGVTLMRGSTSQPSKTNQPAKKTKPPYLEWKKIRGNENKTLTDWRNAQ